MTELQRWVDPAMYASEDMPEGINVVLLSATPDPLGSIAAACMIYEGKVCRGLPYLSDEQRQHYFEEVQKTHLQAPLEFVDFHFMIEGVTRAFTHQLVRQRTAVYAQESLRFAVKEHMSAEIPLPPSIADGSEAEKIWSDAVEQIEDAYNVLINRYKVPAEDARGLLPHQVTTRVHYKTNLRSLAEHAGNRLCTQAQFEWREVFAKIIESIFDFRGPLTDVTSGEASVYDNRWQFTKIATSALFRPVCYKQGKCPFNAEFDRGCTIRPRVEEGRFDEIETSEWLYDHAAARKG